MTNRHFLAVALLLFPVSVALAQQPPLAPMLNIVIVEGDGAINNIKQRTSRETVVEVQDENHRPVAGAAVVFLLPGDGPGGAFAGGSKSVTLTTNTAGRATMPTMQPNQVTGQFQIRVNASSQGRTASVTIGQTNAVGVAAGAGGAAAGISAKTIGIIVAVAAAGAVGAAVGLKGGKNNNPATTPTPSVTGTISTGGGVTFGPPPWRGLTAARKQKPDTRRFNMRLPLHRFLLPFVFAALASADGSISGPVAGYATDASGAQLRAILGVPGALDFGDPLALPEGVAEVRLAPGQDFALVERSGDTAAVLFLKDGAIDRMTPIAGALSHADWIAFSPAGRSALLYSSSSHRLQVVSGLPDAPQVGLDLDASALPEAATAGGVSDDGSLVVAAAAGVLYRLPSQGAAQVLVSTGGIRSIAMLRNSTDVAVADSISGSVHVVRNAATSPEARVVASGLDGIGSIFPSSNGRLLYVARPGASSVSSVDLTSGEVQSLALEAAPDSLLPLRNRDTFLVSAKAHQPGWIFYQDGAATRSVFIPAARTTERGIHGKGGN